jgi:hypothetical protein
MTSNLLKKPKEPKRIRRYSYCPHCGQKGLYNVARQYCRCRYCGLYRIQLPGQDF